jgi:hypothetical protein
MAGRFDADALRRDVLVGAGTGAAFHALGGLRGSLRGRGAAAPRSAPLSRLQMPWGDETGAIRLPGGVEKPVRRVYEPHLKHRTEPYLDRGRIVSRAPRGDCQAILDCSIPRGPRNRVGVEPETGLSVELRRHEVVELEDEILEKWHGYVPRG